jgi:putative MATE family efflux protein
MRDELIAKNLRPLRIARPPPKFVSGSLLRHILVMAGTGGLGLGAIFLGDLANIAFLSWLKDETVVAAVGYASSIMFFTISIGIGLSIAASALVSPAIGAGLTTKARRLSVNAHFATLAAASLTALVVWLAVPWLLTIIGASGPTHAAATGYLRILIPSLPFVALGMTSSAILRSVGDARRAMHVTLWGAVVNTALDPIFIFVLGLGIDGAAIASLLARVVVMIVGLYGVLRVHDLVARPRLKPFLAGIAPFTAIAVPAILTNIAAPVSMAYVTSAIAVHGDSAVAGWAIIGRIMPVAFGAIYALSGSIGPVIGQNYGAGNGDRMRLSLTLSLAVNVAFTALAWVLLALLAGPLVDLFHATGESATLIFLFCRWLAPLFAFFGALFVSNAAFNTLGRPHYSTLLNWGRATLGTIPLVIAGSALAGASGVLVGYMLSATLFGVLAVVLCYRTIAELSPRTPGNSS